MLKKYVTSIPIVVEFFINQKGSKGAIIGGVKLLTDFSPDELVLKSNKAIITLSGDHLEIVAFSENEIEISGKITNIAVEYKRGARS